MRCSTATSISPSIAARTCRRCCRTDWTSAPFWSAKIRGMRWCCRTRRSTSVYHEDPRRTEDPRRIAGQLPDAARIGTGSVRRIAQLTALFPGASFANVRGNLDTRLRKLDSGDYDLLVLAAAGLRRLGFSSRISATLPIEDCVPAPGQGIIAVEIRTDDHEARKVVSRNQRRGRRRRACSRAGARHRPGRWLPDAHRRYRRAGEPRTTSSFMPSSHHSTAPALSAIRRLGHGRRLWARPGGRGVPAGKRGRRNSERSAADPIPNLDPESLRLT